MTWARALLGQKLAGGGAGVALAARIERPGRRSGKEGMPERPARHPFRQEPLGGVAERTGERSQQAEGRRQHGVDTRPDQLGEHGGRAFRTDGHDQRRAVDDGRRVEVAQIGAIDGVDGYADAARIGGNPPVQRLVGCCGKDQRRTFQTGWLIACFDEPGAIFFYPLPQAFLDAIGHHHQPRIRLADQPRLGKRLVAIADNHHAPPLDPHEDGEGVELGGRVRHGARVS